MKFAKTCLVLANPHGRALDLNEAHAAESGMFSSIVRMEAPTADALLALDADLLWIHDARLLALWRNARLPECNTWTLCDCATSLLHLPEQLVRMFMHNFKTNLAKRAYACDGRCSFIVHRHLVELCQSADYDTLKAAASARFRCWKCDDFPLLSLGDDPGDAYVEAMAARRAPEAMPAIPEPARDRDPGLLYLTCSFGGTPVRDAAALEALAWLCRSQATLPRIVFMELREDGVSPLAEAVAALPVEHVVEPMLPEHRWLFQKEAMFNRMLARYVEGSTHTVVCADNDVLPVSPFWTRRIRETLAANPDALCQPYLSWADTKQARGQYGMACRGIEKLSFHAPGFAWAFRADIWRDEARPWFNPMCIPGSGDCCAIFEHAEKAAWDGLFGYHFNMRWFSKIVRMHDFPKHPVVGTSDQLWHAHHGSFADRAYTWSRSALDVFGDMRLYVRVGEDGLLRWRDPDCPPAKLLARKPELQCLDSVRKVLAEIMAPQHDDTGHKRLDGWEMTP